MKHLKYAWYILKHKWYVMLECFEFGLYWQGITHDLSKLLPDEWFPYVNYFYGDYGVQNKCPAKWSNPGDIVHKTKYDFDFACLLHQRRNPHHWQWWIAGALEMPQKYRTEMLCDWRGAGKAQGHGDDTKEWYQKNKDKMQLHPLTRKWIEAQDA